MDVNHADKYQRMAAIYKDTNPALVASIFESLTEEECAAILYFMEESRAAKVIEAYTSISGDEARRSNNVRRISEITSIMQKLTFASINSN